MSVLGDNIKKRREELGLSQDDLAHKLGYKSRSTVNKIEKGINDITQTKIESFAQALDCTPGYLMGWEDHDNEVIYNQNQLLTESFGNRLKQYMDSHELTYEELSSLTGVPAQTLNHYILGQREPKIETASHIAAKINVNPLWLQGYDVSMHQDINIEKPPEQVLKEALVKLNIISNSRDLTDDEQERLKSMIALFLKDK